MQPEHIYPLVQAILHPKDNQSRKDAEAALLQLYSQYPQDIVVAYLDILEMQPSQHTIYATTLSYLHFAKFIALQLNNCLSKHPRHPYQPLWHKLSQSTQQSVKRRLCGMLEAKRDVQIAKQIGGVIGNLGSHLIEKDEYGWAQLGDFIVSLAGGQECGLWCALVILQNFYMHELKNYKQIIVNLSQLFQLGLQIANTEINYCTLRCIAAYLLVLDHSRHRQFGHLIPIIMKTVLDMLSSNNSLGLAVLVECLQYQPKFFKQSFSSLLSLCQHIINTIADQKIKRTITTALLQYSYLCPSLFRCNTDAIHLLVDMIALRMLVLPQDVARQWMAPQQGFNSQLSDQPQIDIIRDNLCLLNKLIRAVGQNYVMARVKHNIDALLSTDKWTYHYTAVAMLSQLGQYISHIDEIQVYISLVFGLFKHSNPKLRYIAVHAVGMIAQQRKQEVISKYSKLFISRICELLVSQQCPRVVSHIWNALSNLLTNFPYHHLQPYQQQLMAAMMDSLSSGISVVKQSALYALAQLVAVMWQSTDKRVMSYLSVLIPQISQYFYNGEYLKPCYNSLRGYALQALSSIALTMGRDAFRMNLTPLTTTLFKLQSQQYNSLVPPYGYIITAWTRLAYTFGSQLAQYIHAAMPTILSFILSNITTYSQQPTNQQHDQQQCIVSQRQQRITDMTKQIELGVKMMNSLMANIPAFAQCYYEEISAIYVALVSHSPDEDLKRQVYESLATFVDGLADDAKKVQTAVHLIELIVVSICKQGESALIDSKLKSISCMLSQFSVKILPAPLLTKVTSALHHLLITSSSQMVDIMQRSVGFDSDELEQAQAEIASQQSKQQAISNVFTQILHLYGNEVAEFALVVLRCHVLDIFQEGQRDTMVKIGLFIIDDILQYIDYCWLQPHWLWVQHVLERYTQSNSCRIRQAACFGLGIFSQKNPKQLRNQQNAVLWLQLLHRAFLFPRNQGDSKSKYYNCRDNTIAAMGKIISQFIEAGIPQEQIWLWLSNLPLRWDRQQNNEMIDILVQLLAKSRQVMCEHSKGRTLQLLRVIAEQKQLVARSQMAKLKRCMEMVVNSSLFIDNSAELMGGLGQKARATLQWLYDYQPASKK